MYIHACTETNKQTHTQSHQNVMCGHTPTQNVDALLHAIITNTRAICTDTEGVHRLTPGHQTSNVIGSSAGRSTTRSPSLELVFSPV